MTEPKTFLEILQWTPDLARDYLEAIRWPNGPACPSCAGTEIYRIEAKTQRNGKPQPTRHLLKCKACKRQFTATVGTVFEDSHIPLNKWLAAIYLMCASKKGISAHQIHRMLGVTYKTAWFMCHRVRLAMQDKSVTPLSGIIEADETYVGGKPRRREAKYLECYVDEFSFRFNARKMTDEERFASALGNVQGRLAWFFGQAS